MKKIILVLIVVTGFMACNSPEKGDNGVTYKSPVQYNDYIISRQTTLIEKIMKFSTTAQTDLDAADKLLDGYALDASAMIKDIKGMPAYKKDTDFRDAAIGSFTFYRKLFDGFYKDIIRIRKEDAADADEQIDIVLEKLTAEEAVVDKTFHNAQEKFAKKNNMRLKDNEIQKKIDAAAD